MENFELAGQAGGEALQEEEVYVFPMSFGQQRLWFLDQLEPDSPFYNIPAAIRFRGALDAALLSRCVNEIIARHESLRTLFGVFDGAPSQIIYPFKPVQLPVEELQLQDGEEREAGIIRLAKEEAGTPFNLGHGPLLRVRIIKAGEADHVVLFTMHHIISDGWSMGVLIREVTILYDAFSHNRPNPLPPLEIQYGDFAVWQQEHIAGAILDKQIEYWKKQLGGSLPVLELPTDYPRAAVQSVNGGNETLTLDASFLAIKELARQNGATLYMVLLAAFQLLLYRYTELEDICVGSPFANRNRAEIENLIGFFVNTLVIRSDLAGDPSFLQLLEQVRKNTLDAHDNQDVPFERLVEVLQPDRALSHSPIFQVMFILQNATSAIDVEFPGMAISSLEIDNSTSTFELTLMVTEAPDGFVLAAEYNSDLFSPATIKRFLQNYRQLLRSILENPAQRISDLAIMPEEERRFLVEECNRYAAVWPEKLCVHHLFEARAAEVPERVAAVFADQSISYGDLNRSANKMARRLRRLGIGPEVPVAICIDKSVELLVAVLGVMKSSGFYVPIDPSYPQDRIAYMLENSSVSVMIAHSATLEQLPPVEVPMLVIDQDWADIENEADGNPDHPVDPDNLVYMIYTSGSTGKAKGTMISHRSLVNAYLAWEVDYRLRTDVDSHLQMASFSFDVFAGDFVRALCSGGKLVLCPRDYLLDAEKLYQLMLREKVNCSEFVPAVLRNLIEYLEQTGQNLFFVRNLIAGSDIWYVKEYLKFLSFCGPDTRLINSFGLTEATIDSTFFEGSVHDYPADRLVPIGRPFANSQLYVIDRHMGIAPVGIPGELCVAGVGLARGYHGRPELTAEKFIANPFSTRAGERLYRTGDLARILADGNIEFLGRIDSQVKIRGYRIELGEIESVLAKYPGVDKAIVIAREDKGGAKRLVAYVVPAAESEISVSEIKRILRQELPEYMVPSAVVILESLPLTPNGKIDRRSLPAPDDSAYDDEKIFVALATPTQVGLAEIWTQLLDVGTVGATDNFFEIGGHSLLATQLVSKVREQFKTEIPLRAVFEYPLLAEMATAIDKALGAGRAAAAPPMRRIDRDGVLPLSFAQERLWFLDQLEPNSPYYNIPECYRLEGELNADLFATSLELIVARHESLRTVFRQIDGKPSAVILPELHTQLRRLDLRGLAKAEREEEILRLAAQEAQKPFDLTAGPLFRAALLRTDAAEHVLLFTIHHIVSDNWSTNVLIRELSLLYESLCAGQGNPLPELMLQYTDYAAWQRSWLQGEVLEQELTYWKRQLAGVPPVLELPTDRPRPAMQSFNGAYHSFELAPALSQQIKKLAAESGATTFMIFLAAFQVLLSRLSAQEDICVGSPIAGRTTGETEAIVGFFVNTLVFRTRVDDALNFRELLAQVREMALDAYAHQELPFEKIVSALQPERHLSHSPLFQVMFAMQEAAAKLAGPGTGLAVSPIEAHSGTSKFDLTLFMLDEGEKFSGALEYCSDLFDASTISRFLHYFEHLLELLIGRPESRMANFALLTPAEHEALRRSWGEGEEMVVPAGLVHHLFEQQAAGRPEAIAAVCGAEEMSYGELERRANKLANFLRQMGIGRDQLVGISIERSFDLLVGLLAVLKAGAAYLPLDVNSPPERLAYMMEDAGIALLLTQAAVLHKLPRHTVTTLCIDNDWAQIEASSPRPPQVRLAGGNLAYVIYTSGSTGRPKGTLITHEGLCNYLAWCRHAYPIEEGSGSVVHATIAFDATVTSIFPALIAGKTLVVVPESEGIEGLPLTLRAHHHQSLIKITPAQLAMLSQQLAPEEAHLVCRSLVIGGENLTADQIAFWQQHAPQTLLFNEYGPTETVVGCVVFEASGWRGEKSVPIGRVIPNMRIYILDRNLQPVPAGVSGELYIGGIGLARGYLGRPDLTAERFLPDPFAPQAGARLYKTGDLVRTLADGTLEFLGRLDDQVKIKGYRIELGEVEAALHQHPDLSTAAVLAKKSPAGETVLVAYGVARDGRVPTTTDLRQFLGRGLPDYMIPAFFIMLDEMPLTANGKVDRKALPEVESERPELSTTYAAPGTAAEATLVQIWQEVLGLEQVGVHDNFFELGGDSILSLQIVARAFQAGLTLNLRDIFQHPTIAELAGLAPAAVPVFREQGLLSGEVKLTPIQAWFFSQQLPEPHHYNQSMLLRIDDQLDAAHLCQAVSGLIRHHDALRLRFVREDEEWRQYYSDDAGTIPFAHIDLSAIDEAQRARSIEQAAAAAQASLDLSHGPLIRVLFFDGGAGQAGSLLIIVHHLAMDGVSWPILFADLQTLYMQAAAGEVAELPAKSTSFRHWSNRLHEYAAGAELAAELGYWEGLAGAAVAPLPRDFPHGRNTEASTATVGLALSDEETAVLLQRAPQVRQTQIHEVLLAALAMAFREWTGEPGLLVELEGHGRESLFDDVDLSRTIGWFTSLHPLLLDPGPDGTEAADQVAAIQAQIRALPHHGIGYGLMRYLRADAEAQRVLDSIAHAEVVFNYLGQMDQGMTGGGAFQLDALDRGPERSPHAPRLPLVEVTAIVSGGQLQLEWTYSKNIHRSGSIERLAGIYSNQLSILIDHFRSSALPEGDQAAVDEFGWNQEDLDELTAQIEQLIE